MEEWSKECCFERIQLEYILDNPRRRVWVNNHQGTLNQHSWIDSWTDQISLHKLAYLIPPRYYQTGPRFGLWNMEYMESTCSQTAGIDFFLLFFLSLSYYATALHESYRIPPPQETTHATPCHSAFSHFFTFHSAFRSIIVSHDDMNKCQAIHSFSSSVIIHPKSAGGSSETQI